MSAIDTDRFRERLLAERDRLHNESRRIRTQLTHALETIDAETPDPAVDDVEPEAEAA